MNIRTPSLILLAAICFAGTQLSFGQSAAITEQEYWSGVITGNRATANVYPRRLTKVYESISDGNVTYSRTEVSEYLSSDSYRTIKTVVRNGVKSVSESLQIGKVRYCREDSSEWKSSGCYQQPPPPLGDSYETTYSLEVKKDSKTFVRIAKSQHVVKEKPEPIKHITEDRFVLNADSNVSERSIITMIDQTKTIVSKDTAKYEYQITLKPIEAPIK